MTPPQIALRWRDLETVLRTGGADALKILLRRSAPGGPPPRRDSGPGYTCLAGEIPAAAGGQAREARRSLVLLDTQTLFIFDRVVSAADPPVWLLGGEAEPEIRGASCSVAVSGGGSVLHAKVVAGASRGGLTKSRQADGDWQVKLVADRTPATDPFLLGVAQLRQKASDAPATVESCDSVDLAGARAGDRVVLFPLDGEPAGAALSFSIAGGGKLKLLLSGLAPRVWEVWWNGWLEHSELEVGKESGTLYFEGLPGSYFLRRRG